MSSPKPNASEDDVYMTCKVDGLRVPWKTVNQVKEQVDVEAANIKNKNKSTSEIHKYALEWRRGMHPPCKGCEKKPVACRAHDNSLRCSECARMKRRCSLFTMCAISYVGRERNWSYQKVEEIYSVNHGVPLDTKRKRPSNLLDSDSYQDGEHSSSASPVATPKKKQNLGQVQLAASGSRPSNLGVTESLQPIGSRNFACVEIPSGPHREATLARLPAASLSLKRSVADEEKTPFSSALRYLTQDMNVAARLPLMTAGPVLPKKAGSSLLQQNHPSTSTLFRKNRTDESTFMELEEELERERNKFKRTKESLKLLRNENKDLKAKLKRKTANERSLKEQLSDKNTHLLSIVDDAIHLWQLQAPQFLKPLLHLLKNTYKRVKQSASAPGDRASSEELRQAVVYLEVALKECCTGIIGEEGLERLKILGGKADEEIKHRLWTYYAGRPEMFGPDIEAALESVFESK